MELESSSLTPNAIQRSSLAKQITNILRREIHTNFKPGQCLPPIMELAKSFGVSYQTVRESLSVLEAQGLVDRRSGSGTFVCDQGQRRPAQHVAVWCERDIFDPHASYFYRYVPRQLVRFFKAQGFDAKMYVGEVSHAEPPRAELTCTEFAHAVEQRRICGVVALDEPIGSGWLEPLRQQNIPVVRSRETHETDGQSNAPRMLSNKALKGRMGAEYLLNHGRRRLALMQWLEPQSGCVPDGRGSITGARISQPNLCKSVQSVDPSSATAEQSAVSIQQSAFVSTPSLDSRLSRRAGTAAAPWNPTMDGFTAALAEAGVQINPKWIRNDLPPGAPGAGWEEFREIWAAGAEKPDGLLVCDDVLFTGAAMAILQLGIRVPEDLLVITHYNKGSGMMSPFPVAKLQMDPHEYVRGFGQSLVNLMRGEPAENRAATIELVQETGVRRQETEYDGEDPQITPIPQINDSGLGTLREENDAAGTGRRAGVRRPRKAQQV